MTSLLTLLLAALLLVGCDTSTDEEEAEEPVVWGECGPPELQGPVPKGVMTAAEQGTLPGGIAHGIYSCNEDQDASLGAAYLTGYISVGAADEGRDDFISFTSQYVVILHCDDDPRAGLWISEKEEGFKCVGVGGFSGTGDLDEFLGTGASNCRRGLFHPPHEWASFVIATSKSGETLIYPLTDLDDDMWGDGQGSAIGEFSYTKKEFLDWWQSTGTSI